MQITSSPRPSILRKRDHEGSPLKAAKNLASALQTLGQQTLQAPASPPSPPRPDSRGNGHSSGKFSRFYLTEMLTVGYCRGKHDDIGHVQSGFTGNKRGQQSRANESER